MKLSSIGLSLEFLLIWGSAFICQPLAAQSISASSGLAPTSFSEQTNLDEPDALKSFSGSQLRDSGSPASLQSFSVRGDRSKDTSVSLEGVPLNSPASGVFDLGLMNNFGLGEARLIRGGYSPLGTSSNGQLLMKLPTEDRYRFKMGYGSFDTAFIGQELPYFSISLDQSENNYRYKKDGALLTRENNSHRRANLRAWIKRKNWQAWTQVLYNKLELPGSVDFASTPLDSETWQPTFAIQGRKDWLEASARVQFQNQKIESFGNNKFWSGGLKASAKNNLTKSISTELIFDEALDHLSSDNFPSQFRSNSSLSGALIWIPHSQVLLHPYIRGEYTSELSSAWGLNPGIGIKVEAAEALSLLANLSYLSRAPNFNELYFEIPNVYAANPNLKREKSLQGDFGYRYTFASASFEQAFFFSRKEDLIQDALRADGLYQAQNGSSGRVFGLENSLWLELAADLDLSLKYTFQDAGSQVYQPRHRLNAETKLFKDRKASLGIPVYARSRTRVSSTDYLNWQWDLGLKLNGQLPYLPAQFQLSIQNLLGWNREETKGYPLSSEPFVFASISAEF